MKTFFNLTIFGLWLSITTLCYAQQQANKVVPPPTPYTIISRDANSRVWEQTTYEISSSGQIIPHKHHFIELASGLCYQQNGQWVDSQERISILADGSAAATTAQHQAYFPANIYNGVIKLVTPDGLKLKGQPMGLSYDDGTNTVLIAELTNSVGQLISSNQIIYANAFVGIDADLLYTYRKSGFEQDVIFRKQPPAPEEFGMNSANTRLQMLTEFFDTPAPVKKTSHSNRHDGLQDTTLTFGKLKMARGKAFLTEGFSSRKNSLQVPIYKSWIQLGNRTLLVEQTPYQQVKTQLSALHASTARLVSPGEPMYHLSAKRLLPVARVRQGNTDRIELAKANISHLRGVVLDFVTIDSDLDNYTFQGDTTYWISGPLDLSDTTTLEGGTVIKYASDASLIIDGTLNCAGGPYQPSILTSDGDMSVGEPIEWLSSGGSLNDWADNALEMNGGTINNVRISYAYFGVFSWSDISVTNVQVANCYTAFYVDDEGSTTYENVLVANADVAFGGGYALGSLVENATVVNCMTLFGDNSGIGIGAYIYNSIMANMDYLGEFEGDWIGGNNNAFYNFDINSQYNSMFNVGLSGTTTTIWPFKAAGEGSYYLADNTFRGQGTPNIDPGLLAQLAQKTTWAPTIYSNQVINTDLTLGPSVPRDTAVSPDLGYHYDPLDYVFGGCDIYSNLTFTAGTDVGWFEGYGSMGQHGETYDPFDPYTNQPCGLSLTNGATLCFNGNATEPVYFVKYNMVQEGGNSTWTDSGLMGAVMFSGNSTGIEPQLAANFTKFIHDNGGGDLFRDDWSYGVAGFQNCEFYNASFSTYDMQYVDCTNCLFFRYHMSFYSSGYPVFRSSPGMEGYAASLSYDNCTFYNGYLEMDRSSSDISDSSSLWAIANCSFDGTAFECHDNLGGDGNNTLFDYNAYNENNLSWTNYSSSGYLEDIGPNDFTVTAFNWQPSWFGDFYLPSDSPLIQRGSTYANLLGLADFTTQTSQTPNGLNIVDIGYHYIAADPSGNPVQPPFFISAGTNQTIENDNVGYNADLETTFGQLQGVAWTTGGVPPVGPYIYTWSVISAPAYSTVAFANPNLTNTIVEFYNNFTMSSLGTYELMLTASSADGLWSTSSIVNITVTAPDVIPYQGTNYTYLYDANDDYPEFYLPNFDDSMWNIGQAGFGTPDCAMQPNTYWPGNANGYPWLYVRRHFNIPAGSTKMFMGFTVDNDAQIFLNGVLLTPVLTTNVITGDVIQPNVGSVISDLNYGFAYSYTDEGELLYNYYNHQNCPAYDDLILNSISPTIWQTGDNVLAVRVYDNGIASFFDNRITLLTGNNVNQPPAAYAGVNQYINFTLTQKVQLSGVVVDDGLPGNGNATATWSEVSPDQSVVFNPSPPSVPFDNNGVNYAFNNATATFTKPGTYVLRLTANDGQYSSNSDVTIFVDDGTFQPPTVNFVTPGQTAFEGNIPITVTATASQGTIASVQFYATNTQSGVSALIGQVVSSPYTMNWVNVPAGTYTLAAVATDSAGRVTSTSENVTVINPVIARNDNFPNVFENAPNVLTVLANDSDQNPNGELLVTAVETLPLTRGSVRIGSDGRAVVYTPPPNYLGNDTFTYTASDGPWSSTATVTVTVINPVQAYNNSDTVFMNASNIVTLNDSDQHFGGKLTIASFTLPSHGSLTINGSGQLVYTPQSMQLSIMPPPVSGGQIFSANAVNNSGLVCGSVTQPNGNRQAAIWQIGGGILDLDPKGTSSSATSVNDNGNVVGYKDIGGGVYHAFEYSSGQLTDLHNQVSVNTGYADSVANGINSSGQICGQLWNANPPKAYQAFFMDTAGNNYNVTQFTPFGGLNISANGIGNDGTVVGESDTTTTSDVFEWFQGGLYDLSYEFPAGENEFALAIDDNGSIAGYTVYNNNTNAYVYDYQLEDLSDGNLDSWAYAINNLGGLQDQAVGAWASSSSAPHRAFYWLSGQSYDLNGLLPSSSGWQLNDATAVNANQLIVGNGNFGGNYRAFATYAPAQPYTGGDLFTYTVVDGVWSNTATVTLTVENPLHAQDDGQTVFEGMATNIAVLENDNDDTSAKFTVVNVQGATKGQTSINSDGTIEYTPTSSTYTGDDYFTYAISDGKYTATAHVDAHIIDPIQTKDDGGEQTIGGQALTIYPLQYDKDESQQTMTIVSLGTQGTSGRVQITGNGQSILYTPPQGAFLGYDSFTYTVSDGTWSATATVTVNVENPITQNENNPPTIYVSTSTGLNVLGDDSDANSAPLTITGFTPGQHGSVTLGPGNQVIYTAQNMQLSIMSPPAGQQFTAYGVNNNGLVCGSLVVGNVTHAAVWQIGGGITDLDPAGINNSVAQALNDQGIVVGYQDIGGGIYHAVEYRQGQISDLHSLVAPSGYSESKAFGIDLDGNVCGQAWSGNPPSASQAFFLDYNNNLSPIGSFGGSQVGAYSIGFDINDYSTAVVGESDTPTTSDAFEWEPGNQPVDLSSFYSFPVPNQVARGINSIGDIVGYSTPNSDSQAFAITNGILEDLSSGYQDSWAYALNSQDQTVGSWAGSSSGAHHAVFWQNGQNSDLTGLLPSGSTWVLNDALSINENGLIVGNGSYQGNSSAFATYAPTPPYQGGDGFWYTVSDGTYSATFWESFTVVDPVQISYIPTQTVYGNTSTTINLLRYCSDQITGTTLTITSAGGATEGNVVNNQDGTVTYTPTISGSGQDSFNFTVSDGTYSAIGTVSVTIDSNPVHAVNHNAQALGNLGTVINVMNGCTDDQGTQLTLQGVTQGNYGHVVMNGDGQTVTYTPNNPPQFGLADSFTYTVSDGTYAATATVSVNITEVPVPPVLFNSPAFGTLPATVTLSVPGYPNATITFQVDNGNSQIYSGPISIASDSIITAYATQTGFFNSGTNSQEFGNPLAPVAQPDYIAVNPGDNTLNVLENDVDSEGLGLQIVDYTVPRNGTATINDDGTLHYAPTPGFYGIDSFSYTVQGYSGFESTAIVIVFVNKSGNNPPTAEAYSATLSKGTYTAALNPLANDSDLDADSLTLYAVTAQPSMGAIVNNGNQVDYSRQQTQFGPDNFTYVVTDGNGGYATANANVDQEDTYGLGMSDEWQYDYFLDVGEVDPTAIAANGLPNLADYELGADPTASFNPLNMSSISLPSQLSGIVTIPLNINPNVDSLVPLTLFVDGQEAVNAVVTKLNQNWVVQWDTTTIANGNHSLSLKYYNENLTPFDFFGDTLNVNINNPLTFATLNDVVCSELVINATVNTPATSYTVDVYDAQTGEYLMTLPQSGPGQIVNGQIQTSWDLTDGHGNTISSGPVLCEFSLQTGLNSPGQSSPNTTTPGPAKLYPKMHFNGNVNNFAAAWGLDNKGLDNEAIHIGFCSGIVNILGEAFQNSDEKFYFVLPHGGSGNVNNPGGGDTSFEYTDYDPNTANTLLNALIDSANFIWVGHGTPGYICPGPKDGSTIPFIQVETALRNEYEVNNPYKLVILVGCDCYSFEWSRAFGFLGYCPPRKVVHSFPPNKQQYLDSGRSTSTVSDYQSSGIDPQAFVGWPCIYDGMDNQADVATESLDLAAMFQYWHQGNTIYDCMNIFSYAEVNNMHKFWDGDEGNGIQNDLKWELTGCRDLKISDRQ